MSFALTGCNEESSREVLSVHCLLVYSLYIFLQIRGEYRDLLVEYRTIKTESNQLKLKHTELKGDMADCRDQLNKLDIQNAKLTNKCEVGLCGWSLCHMSYQLTNKC